jgi:hypothetical protein
MVVVRVTEEIMVVVRVADLVAVADSVMVVGSISVVVSVSVSVSVEMLVWVKVIVTVEGLEVVLVEYDVIGGRGGHPPYGQRFSRSIIGSEGRLASAIRTVAMIVARAMKTLIANNSNQRYQH